MGRLLVSGWAVGPRVEAVIAKFLPQGSPVQSQQRCRCGAILSRPLQSRLQQRGFHQGQQLLVQRLGRL